MNTLLFVLFKDAKRNIKVYSNISPEMVVSQTKFNYPGVDFSVILEKTQWIVRGDDIKIEERDAAPFFLLIEDASEKIAERQGGVRNSPIFDRSKLEIAEILVDYFGHCFDKS